MKQEIKWTGSDGDYTAVVGEYTFSAFVLGELSKWLWYVMSENHYFEGEDNSLDEAKSSAETAYYNHINK